MLAKAAVQQDLRAETVDDEAADGTRGLVEEVAVDLKTSLLPAAG